MVTIAQHKGTGAWSQHATPLWVGCQGQTGRLELALGGDYRSLTGSFGLHAAFDADVRVRIMVLADGSPLASTTLDSEQPTMVPLQESVTGIRTITIEAAAEGDCTGLRDDIAFLGDGAAMKA